jgi:hypothetical protein
MSIHFSKYSLVHVNVFLPSLIVIKARAYQSIPSLIEGSDFIHKYQTNSKNFKSTNTLAYFA